MDLTEVRGARIGVADDSQFFIAGLLLRQLSPTDGTAGDGVDAAQLLLLLLLHPPALVAGGSHQLAALTGGGSKGPGETGRFLATLRIGRCNLRAKQLLPQEKRAMRCNAT